MRARPAVTTIAAVAADVPRLGKVTGSIDATDLILAFFAAHTGTH